MSEVRVRPATPDDAAEIAHVQVATWQGSYRGIVQDDYLDGLSVEARTERWREGLAPGTEIFGFVARDAETDRIIGFVTGGPRRRKEVAFEAPFTGELYAIYLLPDRQRSGAGTALVRALADELLRRGHASMLVWTLEAIPACSFYEALGGRRLGTQPTEIGGAPYSGVAYGWDDLGALARRLAK